MRICVSNQYIWGLQPANQAPEFMPLWCEDWTFAVSEFGREARTNGIDGDEVRTLVLATECETPPEAWAALAYYRLTGERLKRQ